MTNLKITMLAVLIGAAVGLMMVAERSNAGVGPGYSDSFAVTCQPGIVTRIAAPSGQQFSYTCQANDAVVKVYVGDSGVSPADAPFYCSGAGCQSGTFGGNVREEFCTLDPLDPPTDIVCRAMTGTPQ